MRWYYGWNMIAVAAVFQALILGVGFYCFTFWVTPWMQEFHVGRADIMLAISVATIFTGLVSPMAGRAMDRYSLRAIICGGTLVFTLGMVLISQATAAWQIIVVFGACTGSAYAFSGALAAQTLVGKWFRGRLGLAIGLASVGVSVGGFLMPPLATWLLQHFGWRHAYLVLAALVAGIVIPLVWWTVRVPNDFEDPTRSVPEASDVSAPARSSVHSWALAQVLRERVFWVIGVAFFGASIAIYAFQQNVAPFALELGFEPQAVSLLVSVMSAATVFGRLLFGGLADSFDPRYAFWLALLIVGLAIGLTLGSPGYAMTMATSTLIGLGGGGLMPICCAMVGQKFGARAFGRVMGMVTPFWSAAAASGPVLSGAIRDATSSYRTAFGVYLLVIVPAALVMLLLRRRDSTPATASETR